MLRLVTSPNARKFFYCVQDYNLASRQKTDERERHQVEIQLVQASRTNQSESRRKFSALARTNGHLLETGPLDNGRILHDCPFAMTKQTAIVDNSLFHLICEQTSPGSGHFLGQLCQLYRLVVPPVLIEEVLVSMMKGVAAAGEMGKQVEALKPFWIEDVIELAYRELVLDQVLSEFPEPNDTFLSGLSALDLTHPESIRWNSTRVADKKETIRQRKEGQDKFTLPGKNIRLRNEQAFFQGVLHGQVLRRFQNDSDKLEMLNTILGDRFNRLHPKSTAEIERAFRGLTVERLAEKQITLKCLLVRLSYCIAPCVEFDSAPMSRPSRKLLDRGSSEQRNNLEDEEYVVTALLCDRLLTSDEGMRDIAQVFQTGGLWTGNVIFIDRNKTLADQIPQLLT